MLKKYYYSLTILLLFGILGTYFRPPDGSIMKLIINIHIYLSFIYLPFQKLFYYDKYFSRQAKYLIFFLLTYGILNILRDLFKGELISLLGNQVFGPSFIVPLFLLWGSKKDAIYWLNKICLLSIKIGIVLFPFSFFFKIGYARVLYYPTFFLLLSYNYLNRKNRIWILISLLLGCIAFWETDYRSGIVRILMSIGIFAAIQLNFRWLYKYIALLMILLPFILFYLGVNSNVSIFQQFAQEESIKGIFTDTRTFLYVESISDLLETKNIILGKGPLGTYYSEHFRNWEGDYGDHYIRHNIEIGVLHYLLKGGIIYLILFITVISAAIYNSIKRSKNNYTISLSLILASFFLYSFIENFPSYSFSFALYWIIAGICLSHNFTELNEKQIKIAIQRKNPVKKSKILKRNQVIFRKQR